MMDEEQYGESQNVENQYEEYDQYAYENQYSQGYDLQLRPSQSMTANYCIVSKSKILQTIDDEIKRIISITSMEYSWSFELYYRCNWNFDTLYKVLDGKFGFKDIVNYQENYTLARTKEARECNVCLDEGYQLINSCGHGFCENCWRSNLETSLYMDKELIPKCQGEDCSSRMNFALIQHFLNAENPNLKEAFNSQLVIQYSRENDSVKVCPHPLCQTTFLISEQKIKPMWCKCEDAICCFCGSEYHFPIACSELVSWEKIIQDQENQWIKIIMYKICPACKNPIEKNDGCNHMTCRCRHQFCWICLNDWRTHGACKGRDQHERMQQERQKILKNGKEYRQKFEECKEGTTRFENMIKRINSFDLKEFRECMLKQFDITMPESEFLYEATSLILVSLRFCRCCIIYKFFRGEENLQSLHFERVNIELDFLDEEITEIKEIHKSIEIQTGSQKISCLKKKLLQKFSPEYRSEMKDKLSKLKEFLTKIFDWN